MKILVVDDSPFQRLAAEQTLAGHDLTIVDNYDATIKEIETGNYEVFLSDLLMPPSEERLNEEGKEHLKAEMPCGYSLALFAVMKSIGHVAVITDANHHWHPAAAQVDRLANTKFSIGNSVLYVGYPKGWYHFPKESRPQCPNCHGSGKIHIKEPGCLYCGKFCCLECGSTTRSSRREEKTLCSHCEGKGFVLEPRDCKCCTGWGVISSGKDWGKTLEFLLA